MSADSAKLVNVTCPHHHERLIKGLWAVFNSKQGVDLDVRWGGQSIRAHQLVVQVFLSMEKLVDEAQTSHQQEGTDNLGLLLEFLYNGCVTVEEEQLDSLLQLANELDFELLADAIRFSRNEERSETVAVNDGQTPTSQIGEQPEIETTSERLGEDRVVECEAPNRKRLRVTRARLKFNWKRKRNSRRIEAGRSEESKSDHRKKTNRSDLTAADDLTDGGGSSSDASARADSNSRTAKLSRPILPKLKPKSSSPTKRLAKRKSTSSETTNADVTDSPQPSVKPSPTTLECRHCDYKTRSKTQFQVHASKHDPSITVFRCDACRRPFFSEDKFRLHRAKHDTYRCGHCDYATVKRWNYYEHLFAVHRVNAKGEEVALLSCPLCPFKARANHELKYHTATKHLPEKPFKCKLCNFSAGRNSDIGVHIKVVHEKRKKFMCEACGFLAVTPFSLERHRVIHSGLKFFKCSDCQASFKDRYALRRHETLHATNNKNFVCEICGHAFNRRSNMKVHLKNVHKTLLDPVESVPL